MEDLKAQVEVPWLKKLYDLLGKVYLFTYENDFQRLSRGGLHFSKLLNDKSKRDEWPLVDAYLNFQDEFAARPTSISVDDVTPGPEPANDRPAAAAHAEAGGQAGISRSSFMAEILQRRQDIDFVALREESTPLLDRDIYKATGTARLQQLYEASHVYFSLYLCMLQPHVLFPYTFCISNFI